MRKCSGVIVSIVALAGGILLGTIFPPQFLVFVLCVLMLVIGVFIIC